LRGGKEKEKKAEWSIMSGVMIWVKELKEFVYIYK
jgi:hypothetical protein